MIAENENSTINKKPIPLSTSADIGTPLRVKESSRKIEIVHDLEKTFRPRYKTDYFGLNGSVRKPRYVTDRDGNHFVMLRVIIVLPVSYSFVFINIVDTCQYSWCDKGRLVNVTR